MAKGFVRIVKLIGKVVLATFLLLVLVISGALFFRAKPPHPPETVADISDIEAYLEALCEKGVPPGLSLLVVKDGVIQYSRGFGLADGPKGIPATEQTIYKWWSITKVFTATAILQLHEQQQLNIDDPVVNHLPYFKVKYPSDKSETVTIRHLLNHSSGMPTTCRR